VFNVCPQCGLYSENKRIDPTGPDAICPSCGHRQRFRRLPLFILTGASATGKTAICRGLVDLLPECVVLESDILWAKEFADPSQWPRYRNLWLRLCVNIHQAGRSVVLCGSATPDQFEACSERRYIGAIHYVATVCHEDELVRRLRDRPSWRDSADPSTLETMSCFNHWFWERAPDDEPPIALLDTTHSTVEESTRWVATWIKGRLVGDPMVTAS